LASAVPVNPAFHSRAKRAIDLTITIPLVVCLAPLLAVLVLLVKLQDGGPVIYRRRVIGSGGEFDAFKFRTMRPDADRWLAKRPALKQEFERNFKLEHDPRVTRLGAILRNSSL